MRGKATLIPFDMKYADEVIHLMDSTIKAVCSSDYTREQIAVWTPLNDPERLITKLMNTYSLIAVTDNEIAGFGNTTDDEIDCLYVSKNHQRMGIGTAIQEKLEKEALHHSDIIHVYASITAKPFFISQGYKEIHENMVERNGVRLMNYYMEKEY